MERSLLSNPSSTSPHLLTPSPPHHHSSYTPKPSPTRREHRVVGVGDQMRDETCGFDEEEFGHDVDGSSGGPLGDFSGGVGEEGGV